MVLRNPVSSFKLFVFFRVTACFGLAFCFLLCWFGGSWFGLLVFGIEAGKIVSVCVCVCVVTMCYDYV